MSVTLIPVRIFLAIASLLLVWMGDAAAQQAGPLKTRPLSPERPSARPSPRAERTAQWARIVGRLIRVDGMTLELELGPSEAAYCRVNSQTEMGVLLSELQPGDILRIDAIRDGDDLVVRTLAREGQSSRRGPSSEPSAVPYPDAEDPGRPVLIRRPEGDDSPAPRRKVTRPTAPPIESPKEPPFLGEPEPEGMPDFDPELHGHLHRDPLIAKAMYANLSFTKALPDFTCHQIVERSVSRDLGRRWKSIDVVEADVVYVNKQEHYQNITVDGAAAGDRMEDTGGTWSTGEFGTLLRNILAPGAAAAFSRASDEDLNGKSTAVYHYLVSRDNSYWNIAIGDYVIEPEHKGRLWIDQESGRVLRVEMEAVGLPYDFPLISIESMVEWDWVLIGDEEELLPSHSANLSCYRDAAECRKNAIRFERCQKFTASSSVFHTDSDIDFGEASSAEKQQ